jgi:hypothetical protein
VAKGERRQRRAEKLAMDETIQVGGRRLEIWPAKQILQVEGDASIRLTTFEDVDDYHPQLISQLLALEQRQGSSRRFFRGAGGTKLYYIDQWDFAEAVFINARAKALFMRVVGADQAFVESSWANIYRKGDYCMPHSHVRCSASIVYFLALGESDPDDELSGRFFFADARLPACCRDQQGCLTNPLLPDVQVGSMIIFPGQIVHSVNPYGGKFPRITLAWNMNPSPITGSRHPGEP